MLIERLDRHGDGFRTASMEVDTKPEVIVRPKAGNKAQTGGKQAEKQAAAGGKKPGPKRKSKADKVCMLCKLYFCLLKANNLNLAKYLTIM